MPLSLIMIGSLHNERSVPNVGRFFFVPEITEKQGMKKIVILTMAEYVIWRYNENAGTVGCGGIS